LALLLSLGKDASAGDMLALLEQKQFFEELYAQKGITVASLEMVAGLDFDTLIVADFVNGLFPHRSYFDTVEAEMTKKKNIVEDEENRAHVLRSTSPQLVVRSYFTETEQENAERMQLKSDRIIANKDLIRISIVSMSALADELI
jgi:superfamily I DNA/RNA helicase